jgi:hypothetical protein
MEALCNANAAAVGGTIATCLTYPVDTISKKLIMSKTQTSILQILRDQGLFGLLAGLESKLAWSFVGKFVFYGSYSVLHSLWKKAMDAPMGFFPDLCAGYLAEFSTLPFALPFEAIATRMQTSKGETPLQAVANVFKEQGIPGFYKGLSAYFALCVTPAITNSTFTQIKNLVLSSREGKNPTLGTLESFVFGAIARTVAVCIMYPWLNAKTKMQAAKKNDTTTQPKETDATTLILRIFKEQGFLALYVGLGPELFRGVLSSAVTLMLKEKIYVWNRNVFVALAKK